MRQCCVRVQITWTRVWWHAARPTPLPPALLGLRSVLIEVHVLPHPTPQMLPLLRTVLRWRVRCLAGP